MKDKMLSLYVKFQNAMKRNEGQGMIEYGLILALIAIVAVVAIKPLGTALKGMFQEALPYLQKPEG